VEIAVERDGRLALAAPQDVSLRALEQLVKQRRQWIYDRLYDKDAFARPSVHKEYVSGEGFYYLGRSYRLKVLDNGAGQPALRFFRGRFELKRDAQVEGRDHFVRWYTVQLEHRLPELLSSLALRMGISCPAFHVRDLGYRWGSCGRDGTLYFHWRVAMLPATLMQSIVAHEMAHQIERRHSSAFREQLDRIIPDFRERSRCLAEHGAEYDL
jgi:predicted metal-dependent hydrolase